MQVLENIENVSVSPINDRRLKMLLKRLETRRQMSAQLEETKILTLMINSLCNTNTLLLLGCLRARNTSRFSYRVIFIDCKL